MIIKGIKTYIFAEKPTKWLFNSTDSEGKPRQYAASGVQWVIRETRRKSGIQKKFTAHTLRHSYATHLLEMGLDIVSLKELLGHSSIETTMLYLHISNLGRQRAFSPLDRIYSVDKSTKK